MVFLRQNVYRRRLVFSMVLVSILGLLTWGSFHRRSIIEPIGGGIPQPVVLPGSPAVASPISKNMINSGEHEKELSGRKYLLYIPKNVSRSQLVPLVLFFHGGGGDMYQAARDYGWKEKAEAVGSIVAFLNGSSRFPRQRLATWNAGNCCGYARDNAIDDIAFVRAVVADIERDISIDRQRIFATGMSNGGMLVHRLACEAADLVTAVAAVAGTDGMGKDCVPSRPVPVLHIHAKDDTHVLFDGGAGQDAFRDELKVTEFTSVAATVSLWVQRNQLGTNPQRIWTVPGAWADLYTGSKSGAKFMLVVTEAGGHSWPGGKAVRGKAPTRAIVANDVIWDFFIGK